jgi:hypothetical protein
MPHQDLSGTTCAAWIGFACFFLSQCSILDAQIVGLSNDCVPAGDSICLRASTSVSVMLLTEVSTKTRGSTEPVVVVATDVRVGHLVVIVKGAAVYVSASAQSAPAFSNSDALVTVDMLEVSSVTGQSVTLAGAFEAREEGGPACDGVMCVPTVFPVHAKVKAGALRAAWVRDSISFDREATELANRSREIRPWGKALVFLYATDFAGGPKLKVFVDGKALGKMADQQYGCFSISPGLHSLRVGRELVELEASGGQEIFIRVEKAESGDRIRLGFTETLELGSEALSRRHIQGTTAEECVPESTANPVHRNRPLN